MKSMPYKVDRRRIQQDYLERMGNALRTKGVALKLEGD
jgi:hypothetical protein